LPDFGVSIVARPPAAPDLAEVQGGEVVAVIIISKDPQYLLRRRFIFLRLSCVWFRLTLSILLSAHNDVVDLRLKN
jgi:hypothetical protein